MFTNFKIAIYNNAQIIFFLLKIVRLKFVPFGKNWNYAEIFHCQKHHFFAIHPITTNKPEQ